MGTGSLFWEGGNFDWESKSDAYLLKLIRKEALILFLC